MKAFISVRGSPLSSLLMIAHMVLMLDIDMRCTEVSNGALHSCWPFSSGFSLISICIPVDCSSSVEMDGIFLQI